MEEGLDIPNSYPETNRLVRYSQAGHRFHYCFAARRSLLLLNRNSGLDRIVIEGDDPSGTNGEYSLDMTEVYRDGFKYDRIKCQFKYSVERINEPFTFSELKDTLVGFAKNYQDPESQGKKLRYLVITNREVSKELKSCVKTIAVGGKPKGRTANSFFRDVKLRKDMLKAFCNSLQFQDIEEDLETQFQHLRIQSASYIAGIPTVDSMNALVDMVARKALPNSDGVITQEDVLSNFCKGVSSLAAFYPAPAKFDEQGEWIKTVGYLDVRSRVLQARGRVFVHAPGGVGKTVTLRKLASDIPSGSVAILFDCFASGEYANCLQYRHAPEKACVQIANELASKGLCNPLLAENGTSSHVVFGAFYSRLECAVSVLRQNDAEARLYLFVDAADNAHMMATDTKEPCFVDNILESPEIDGCTMVFSARTGRMNEFWADYDYERIELSPFTQSEVGTFLRKKFKKAPPALANRLFVRTSGMPRIVAGILADCKTIKDVEKASSFAPIKNFDSFLEIKYKQTLKRYSKAERRKLDGLCRCLVTLPPNVPIEVLGAAANVTKDFIIGFISDWERPLWHSQTYVHFRDEPTETWFKGKFGECHDLQEVINQVAPLSNQYVYVARSLPFLLLKAEAYDELERLAESDEELPNNIHIAERKELKLERLRFAISAMMKSKKYAAAMRLSLLAGGMVSESARRDETLRNNLVFASKVLPKETVEELSATRQVELFWRGSDNLCTAVLLSSLNGTRDEVGVYVESALRWLLLHIEEEQNKPRDGLNPNNKRYAYEASLFGRTQLIANGPSAAVKEICVWNSEHTRYVAASLLAHDCVSFDEKMSIEEMICSTTDIFTLLGIIVEAMDYGGQFVIQGWQKIARKVLALSSADNQYWNSENDIRLSIAHFAVWIARQRGGRRIASTLLEKFILPNARVRTFDSPYEYSIDIVPYYVLNKVCLGKSCSQEDIQGILKSLHVASDYELTHARNRLEKLMPVYVGIIKAYLSADETLMASALTKAADLLNDYQLFRQDKSRLFIDSVSWLSGAIYKDVDFLYDFVEKNANVGLVPAENLLALSRQLYRRGHLETGSVCLSRGTNCFESCKKDPQESPDSLAGLYLQAAEACYPIDPEDARGYFSEALDILSKCGDELLPRWSAVTGIARRLSQPDLKGHVAKELVYEFTRCGEYVRSCVVRDKYYDRDEVFSILVDFDPAYAWATYSRWRDRRVGAFCYDLDWVLETFVQKGAMTIEEAWSFRELCEEGEPRRLTEAVVRTSGSIRFKQKVYNDLLISYGKNGCSKRSFDIMKCLAQQLQVDLPNWLQPKSDDSLTTIVEDGRNKEDAIELSTFDGSNQDWLNMTLSCLKEVWDKDRKFKKLFKNVPDRYASQLLRQLASDERIHQFDISDLLTHLPDAWKKKPSVKDVMPKILAQLTARYVMNGWHTYFYVILACADEFGFGQKITEEFLNCEASVVSLGGEGYFQIVNTGIRLLTVDEMVEVFEFALKRVAEGMDDGFGDGEWTPSIWPDKSFNEVTKDLLWTAMGDPDVKIRWMATHCVVDELLRSPDEMVAAYVKRLPRTDFTPCVANNLPTYVYFSQMHFLIALAKVSKQVAQVIQTNAKELISFLKGQEHVLIRYFGWKALLDAGLSEVKIRGLNPIDCMMIRKITDNPWGFKAVVHEDIKPVICKGGWFPMHYEFEHYWLPSFTNVFGLDENDCQALLRWVASSMMGESTMPVEAQDPRRSQFYDDRSTWVYTSEMPDVSDYNFYRSYHSLLILAGILLKYQSVLQCSEETEDRFSAWIKRLLPVFAPDLSIWQSDVRGNLPECVAHGEELREMIEQQPIKEIDVKKLLHLFGAEDQILINGQWQIGNYAKEIECYLNCALVSKRSAKITRKGMCSLEDPMSLALPTLFDKPNVDWQNHGKYQWRGLFDSDHEYPRYHFDEKDPAAGGLHIVRFNLAKTIREALQLHNGDDHVSLLRSDGSSALVSWYWGKVSRDRSRNESTGTYGCMLEASAEFLNDLCHKFQSELLIELVLKRYKRTYRSGYAEHDEEEKCYHYMLFSPEKGIY